MSAVFTRGFARVEYLAQRGSACGVRTWGERRRLKWEEVIFWVLAFD
ncbi:MAG: hypothetical protein QOI48_4080 [Solirubrobacteraceae bacterium]|jgi:hypothetical protein|nr:hypothetical protein [Solirubrobacteraceae bacterium]